MKNPDLEHLIFYHDGDIMAKITKFFNQIGLDLSLFFEEIPQIFYEMENVDKKSIITAKVDIFGQDMREQCLL
jgi:hypothetical protein